MRVIIKYLALSAQTDRKPNSLHAAPGFVSKPRDNVSENERVVEKLYMQDSLRDVKVLI